MKKEWELKSLGDVCEINTGKWDANHAMEGGTYRFYTCAKEYYFCETKRFSGECLILPGNGVNVGDVYYYNGEFDAYQRTYVLSNIKASARFVYYHMLYYWQTRNINKQFGSATNFIKIGNFLNYKISLPPLPEQQKVVAILEKSFTALATAKENAEKNLQNSRELFESYLQSVFTNPGDEWEEKKLGEIIKLEYGKPLPNSKRKSDGVYPVYGANGEKDRSNEYYYDKYSIIVGRKGSAGEINLTEERFWPLDVTYFVTFDLKKHDLYFIYYILNHLKLHKLAKGVKPGINRNEVYSIDVHIPPLSEQRDIVVKLNELSAETKKLEAIYQQKLNDLEELKKSILQKAFKGELIGVQL